MTVQLAEELLVQGNGAGAVHVLKELLLTATKTDAAPIVRKLQQTYQKYEMAEGVRMVGSLAGLLAAYYKLADSSTPDKKSLGQSAQRIRDALERLPLPPGDPTPFMLEVEAAQAQAPAPSQPGGGSSAWTPHVEAAPSGRKTGWFAAKLPVNAFALLVVGCVAFGITAAFFFMMAASDDPDDRELSKDGVICNGTIVRMHQTPKGVYEVTVKYPIDKPDIQVERTFPEVSRSEGEKLGKGQEIRVRYLERDPRIARLQDHAPSNFFGPVGVGVVCAAMSVMCMKSIVRRLIRGG